MLTDAQAPHQRRPGELGKFIEDSRVSVVVSGLDSFIKNQRGRPQMLTLPLYIHPAASLVNHIAQYGAPATINLPSTYTSTITSLRRGAHISARWESNLVRTELLHQAKTGYVISLPFSSLQHLNNLLISPVAATSQDDRKTRLIYDYSYYGINDASVDFAPTEAMQFGKAFFAFSQGYYTLTQD